MRSDSDSRRDGDRSSWGTTCSCGWSWSGRVGTLVVVVHNDCGVTCWNGSHGDGRIDRSSEPSSEEGMLTRGS